MATWSCSSLHCTSNISLRSRKETSTEESSVNMKIFIGLEDLHAELPGLTMMYFFFLVTSITSFRTYPLIHMQSTNMVKVRTAIMQTYYTTFMIQNSLYFMKTDAENVCLSVGIILITNRIKMRIIFK